MKNINKLIFSTVLCLSPLLSLAQDLENRDTDHDGNSNSDHSSSDHSNHVDPQHEPLDILITGSLSQQGMERIGKPITIVDSSDLRKNVESSIGETLSSVPGVSSTNFGPGASRPIIRGQGKERVRVIENGLENGDVSATSDDHAVTNSALTTERIDILRGPSTLLFGSQAIGGVVNIIDGSIKEEGIGRDVTGKLQITGGDSATDEFSGAGILEGQAGSLNWHLSAFGSKTNDIEIPGFAESSALRELEEAEGHEDEGEEEGEEEQRDILDNSDTETTGFKAGLSHTWKDGFIGFAVRGVDSEYGIPGGHGHGDEEEGEGEEEEEGPVRIDLEQTRIESRGAIHLHDDFLDTIRFGASFSDYSHQELEGSEIGTTFDREAFELRTLFTHHHDDIFEGGLGIQINYDDLTVLGDEAFLPSTQTFSPALFFVEDFSLNENWIWQLGSRYEYTDVNPDTRSSVDFNNISASTGFIWRDLPREYSAALNLSYSQRAPNATELFANGAHIAAQTFEVGDADLDSEVSLGGEIILRKQKGRFRGSLTGFIQDYNDYINLVSQGSEQEGFPVFNYESINARLWGYEVETEYDLLLDGLHKLTASFNLDYVRGRDTDNSENLPRITPIRTKVGLDYSYKDFSSFVEALIVEDQDKTSNFELPTDGYTLLNAGVNYRLASDENNAVDLYLKGTNLTDEEARVHTSFLKDQAPLRGRALFTGITMSF